MALTKPETPRLIEYLKSVHGTSYAPNPPRVPHRAAEQAIFWITNTEVDLADVFIANEANRELLFTLIEREFVETLLRCLDTFYTQIGDLQSIFEQQKEATEPDYQKCKRIFTAIEAMFFSIKVAAQVESVEKTFESLIRNEVYKEFNPRMMTLVTDSQLVSEYMAYLLLLPSSMIDVIHKDLRVFFHQMSSKIGYVRGNFYKEELFWKRLDRSLEALRAVSDGFKQQIDIFTSLRVSDTVSAPTDLKEHINELIKIWRAELSRKAQENGFLLGSLTFEESSEHITTLAEPALYKSVIALFLEDFFYWGLPSFRAVTAGNTEVSLSVTKIDVFTGKAHLKFHFEIESRDKHAALTEDVIIKEIEAYFQKPFRGMLLERSKVDVVTTVNPSKKGLHTLEVRFDFGAATVT